MAARSLTGSPRGACSPRGPVSCGSRGPPANTIPLSPRQTLIPGKVSGCQAGSARLAVLCRATATTTDLYELLGVSTSASDDDIKVAFRKKARKLHPDVNRTPGAEDVFLELKQAYEVLSDTSKRSDYDSQIGLQSVRAKDPRFARFERWRSEVVPDLQMQLAVWTEEIDTIISDVSRSLMATKSKIDAQLEQLTRLAEATSSGGTDDSQRTQHMAEAKERMDAVYARLKGMDGDIDAVQARVKRQYDKRYEQVLSRYPAYPDLVWYDVWEETSDQWLRTSEANSAEWRKDKAALQEQIAAMLLQWQQIAAHVSCKS